MKPSSAQALTKAALFVAITAVCSQLVVPLPGVPFNLGVLAIFLCGAMLPPLHALLSMVAYLLLGLFGVPVFAQFRGGPGVLFGVTGGYLMAYPMMALLVAFLVEKWAGRSRWKRFFAMALALLPCYLLGTTWFAVYLHKSFAAAAMAACVPFIPFDLAKAGLAAWLSVTVEERLAPRVTG